MQKRSADRSAGPLRGLEAALTGLLPTPPTPVQITKGLSLWLDEKRGSRHRDHAKAMASEYPVTARLLNHIADIYDGRAKREDDEVEERSWH